MAVAAFTLFVRGRTYVDAYIAGAVALALLGLGTATVKGIGERIVATTTAASGVPFALVCGLNAVPGGYGRWGLLLGSALALVYSLAAALALGTGTVVFAATAIASFFAAGSALVGGLTHVDVVRVVAGTIAVALAALSVLPRLAVRLARLPLATVPTTSEDLSETDEVGDIDDVSARARVAGEYLTGTQIGCAATVALSGAVLLVRRPDAAVGRAGRDRARGDGAARPVGRRARRADRVWSPRRPRARSSRPCSPRTGTGWAPGCRC